MFSKRRSNTLGIGCVHFAPPSLADRCPSVRASSLSRPVELRASGSCISLEIRDVRVARFGGHVLQWSSASHAIWQPYTCNRLPS